MATKKDNVPVRFLRLFGAYNKGEVAGFPSKKAKDLIDKKIVEAFKVGKTETAEAEKSK